jgi:secreted Zn-dependent insulinase-like peptidase
VISVSSERQPALVEKVVCEFLDKMQGLVETMSPKDFSQHVQSVCMSLLQIPNNLEQQAAHHWHTIWEMRYSFYDKYKVQCSSAMCTC